MKQIKITDYTADKKLFKFVASVLKDAKNSEIFKMIRKKVIKVNGKKSDSDYLLRKGDIVEFFVKDEHFNDEKVIKQKVSAKKLKVVDENKNLIVINKQKGVFIQPDINHKSDTLLAMLRNYLHNKEDYDKTGSFKVSFCNRLDANTSGLVIAAKNHKTLQDITGAFRDRKVTKKYYALVYGDIEKHMIITSEIDTSPNKDNIVKVRNFELHSKLPEKYETATLVRRIANKGVVSLVEVEILTGKKHQIRAHLKAAGFPLVGDRKYFTYTSDSFSRKKNIQSYFLHSHYLEVEGYGEWHTAPDDSFVKNTEYLTGFVDWS